jgi:tetratricopeptide (TPR) repeat protein
MGGKGRRDKEKKQAADAQAASSANASATPAGGRRTTREPTAQQMAVLEHRQTIIRTLNGLCAAQDYQGIVNLTVEAGEVAASLRRAHPSNSAGIYKILGEGHLHSQKYKAALEVLELSRPIYEEIRNVELAANCTTTDRDHLRVVYCDLATCYRQNGCFDKAIVLYKQALAITDERCDRHARGLVSTDFGGVYQELGQYELAIELLETGRAIAEEAGDNNGVGVSCLNHALCYQGMGQYEKAVVFHKQSIAIFEDLRDRTGTMLTAKGLGECETRLGNYTEAIKQHRKYWAVSAELKDSTHQARAALNMGVTLWKQELAEHQARAPGSAAASSADDGVQMQKQISARVREAQHWLVIALECNHFLDDGIVACRVKTVELDANLNLSLLSFFAGQEEQALDFLHAHLDVWILEARERCAGCWQLRGEDAPLQTCGGCKVARSAIHLRIPLLTTPTVHTAAHCQLYGSTYNCTP